MSAIYINPMKKQSKVKRTISKYLRKLATLYHLTVDLLQRELV
jgi:hypothetical protein